MHRTSLLSSCLQKSFDTKLVSITQAPTLTTVRRPRQSHIFRPDNFEYVLEALKYEQRCTQVPLQPIRFKFAVAPCHCCTTHISTTPHASKYPLCEMTFWHHFNTIHANSLAERSLKMRPLKWQHSIANILNEPNLSSWIVSTWNYQSALLLLQQI